MSPRILIAALSVAVMISSAPSFAQQTPETSPAALASPQAKSESASSPAEAGKVTNTSASRQSSAERSTNVPASGKTAAPPAAQPTAKN
jgi:hypothetical protein